MPPQPGVCGPVRIRSSAGAYDVLIGHSGALGEALASAGVVVVDERLRDALPATAAPVVVVVADEEHKDLSACERLALALRDASVRRGDHVVAVGGGVVQDVATFVSSIYMRGLPWTYVPTTLMAMADSCVGGKSSINAGGVKNLVGNIYPPQRVVIDERFLASLPRGAVSAGLAEAVKICFCRGEDSFATYLDRYAGFAEAPAALIEHTLRAKQWFVEVDEHDKKERRFLNFGHTFGHAIETAAGHSISHGAGVAVGVLCALRHPAAAVTTRTLQLDQHCRELLLDVPGLGAALDDLDETAFERAFRSDKKHSASEFSLILPAEHGGVQEVRATDDADGFAAVARALHAAVDSLRGHAA